MKKVLFALFALMLFMPVSAFAADFKFEESGLVNINKSDTAKNLYVAGKSVKSEGDVKGDMFAAGGDVTLDGTVENDLFSFGGTLNINANSGQNVRVAGGTVNFDGSTKEDLLIAGGDVTLGDRSQVDGDLLIAGGSVTLNGKVGGDVKVIADTVVINGQISGNVVLRVGTKLTINDQTKIGKGLTYYAPESGQISGKADIQGGVDFKKTENSANSMNRASFGSALFGILGSIIFLLVLVALLPKWIRKTTENVIKDPWSKVGRGLFALIVVPIVALILMVTIIGLKFAFLGMTAYIFALTIAYSLVALFVGSYLMKLINKKDELRIDWASISLGAVAVALLNLIPAFGSFLIFVALIFALGELTTQLLDAMKQQTEK